MKKTPRLTRIDPSRTSMLRAKFVHAMEIRFSALQRSVLDLVVNQNVLGITTNTQWQYHTDAQKLQQFKTWLAAQVQHHILESAQADEWFKDYVKQAYAKGQSRSFDDLNKNKFYRAQFAKKLDFYNGSRAQFLQSAFSRPASIDRLELLAGRVYSELKGVTDAMSQVMARTLVDGMAQGLSPREVGSRLAAEVASIGKVRARAIARTETIRAHATGQLDALKEAGVQEVGVAVEWDTAKDAKVCKLCKSLQGVVFSIDEAYGLIPRHINCRCAFVPANVGEPTAAQVRTRDRVTAAVKKSLSYQSKKQGSRWAGARRTIAKRRPKATY